MKGLPADAPSLRLALRVEGDFWNAYIAATDTMDGALLFGSIHMSAAADPAVKDMFMTTMSAARVRALTVAGHKPVRMEVRPAPEHERAGRA